MAREEKKYEVLPGTSVPDIKTILNAASDFSTPGVDNIEIKGMLKPNSPAGEAVERGPATEEEIRRLQELGNKVSEEEERSAAESRRKMEEIKNRAVIAPESMTELRQRAVDNTVMSDEKRLEIEKAMKEQAEKEAEEEAKRKAREERRAMQKAAMEQSRAKKQADDQARAEKASMPVNDESQEDENLFDELTDTKEAVKEGIKAQEPATDSENKEDKSGIASADETLDDFSEFL